MRFGRLVLAAALLVGAAPALVGCGVAENIVGGVTDEVRGGVDDAIGKALGGAGITTNGQVPDGFPMDAVPVVGEVVGGGAGPNATGWVLKTRLESAADFVTAQETLEGAAFTASGVNSDSDSGFGSFTSADHVVVLTVATGSDGVVSATYVVTPA
ncbi:MAG TPA: hypothetical protein VGP10_06555 [Marisediminicola sp.]|jgi:hypothetical protein|nr:hypothetical protein [Marisediminicola sp.]